MKDSVLLCVLVAISYIPTFAVSALAVKGCKRDDPKLNSCFAETLNSLKNDILGGSKELGTPSLDPFEITKVALNEKGNQALDLAVEFNDLKVKGLKNAKFLEGSVFDLQKRNVEVKLFAPVILLESKYTVDGKILLLPIKGSGPANLTLGDLDIKYDANFTIEKKAGKEYLKLVNPKLDFTVKSFNIVLTNLFNGDKTLGDTTNKFLNENWDEVVNAFKPVLRETIKGVLSPITRNVFGYIPYDELFLK